MRTCIFLALFTGLVHAVPFEEGAVRSQLARLADQRVPATEVISRLVAIGPSGVEELLSAVLLGELTFEEPKPEHARPLSERPVLLEKVMDSVLSALEAPALHGELLRIGTAPDTEGNLRVGVIQVAQRLPKSRAIDLITSVCHATPGGVHRVPMIRRASSKAVGHVISRNGRSGWQELRRNWSRVPETLRSSWIDQLVELVPGSQVEDLLWSLSRDDEALAAAIVGIAGQTVARRHELVDEAFLRANREAIRTSDSATRRARIHLAVRMADLEALPALLDALDQVDPSESASILRQAQRLTGRRLAISPDVWRAWYRQEEIWFDERFHEVADLLLEATGPELFAAVGEIRAHAAHRRKLAPVVIDALEVRDEPGVRRTLISLLSELGGWRAAELLEASLRDRAPLVRRAAVAGLMRLTGQRQAIATEEWMPLLERWR